MKILVVGGAGYIGSHVCHAFADRGDTVAVLDNFSTGSRVNFPGSAKVFEGDIMDKSFLEKVLSPGWDGVVHLAAFKAAGESMIDPGKFAANNISGTINLLNAMTEADSAPLVFSSSAAIFGEPVRLPINEDHPREPENFYGYTKLEIE
ncbi:MAG: UDP-glucose 4-epimerase, partial [Spirochaetaceae bacterium]|nr:UDP-glucose 4-epimerase [Spirochaetaceae bacterium]